MKPIDILNYKQELEESGISEKTARAIVKFHVTLLDKTLEDKEVATKSDIKALDLKIEQMQLATKSDIKSLDLKIEHTKIQLQGFIVKVFLAFSGFMSLIMTAIKFIGN